MTFCHIDSLDIEPLQKISFTEKPLKVASELGERVNAL